MDDIEKIRKEIRKNLNGLAIWCVIGGMTIGACLALIAVKLIK